MLPALGMPENLTAIFGFLHDNTEDLVNVACVCKAWHEPAVDRIWMAGDVPIKLILGQLGQYTEFSNDLEGAIPMYAEDQAQERDILSEPRVSSPLQLHALHTNVLSIVPTPGCAI